ncbi:hypothetical protein [Ramlibacter alkalitolerans]|uniref:Uncharacterized protein n=1 Tax=Ramlibacter alkalitolerans TaxID=2039631 RepID=A0ABS1JUB2_9BURK|nr:hypothetical protein [Ramlibacter alkalitolerans]MBL0427854.1 hypothetical protein [Ramlibacter alkalitolerans]
MSQLRECDATGETSLERQWKARRTVDAEQRSGARPALAVWLLAMAGGAAMPFVARVLYDLWASVPAAWNFGAFAAVLSVYVAHQAWGCRKDGDARCAVVGAALAGLMASLSVGAFCGWVA